MYIRFMSRQTNFEARTGYGIFCVAYPSQAALNRVGPNPWQESEILRQLAWFNQNLRVPEYEAFYYRAGRKGQRNAVCWFKDQAREHVSRARYLAWLLGEFGIDVFEARSADPGTIRWQDDHQVVALIH